jgi:hypothetical protein
MKFAITASCLLLAFASAQNVCSPLLTIHFYRYHSADNEHFTTQQTYVKPFGNVYCQSADGKQFLRCSDVRLPYPIILLYTAMISSKGIPEPCDIANAMTLIGPSVP